MTLHDHTWPYFTIHDHTWPYMTIHYHTWLYYTWPYRTINVHTWPSMNIHNPTRLHIAKHGHGHTWPFIKTHDHIWPYMTIHDLALPYMTIHGHIWPYITVYDHTRLQLKNDIGCPLESIRYFLYKLKKNAFLLFEMYRFLSFLPKVNPKQMKWFFFLEVITKYIDRKSVNLDICFKAEFTI